MEAPHTSFKQTTTMAKADLGKRFLAYCIDSIIAALIGGIVGWMMPTLGSIAGASYLLLRDGLDIEFMYKTSLGKRALGLRAVRLDGEPMDLETSMRRNWMLALGGMASAALLGPLGWIVSVAAVVLFVYEVYRVATDPQGRRWGDDLAGTVVVEQ